MKLTNKAQRFNKRHRKNMEQQEHLFLNLVSKKDNNLAINKMRMFHDGKNIINPERQHRNK